MFTNPAVADFKTQFFRDFPYAVNDLTDLSKVQDQDITNALNATAMQINAALFDDQASYSYAFLLLSAHNMVSALRASSQGIAGQYTWLQASKSGGSVSEGFSLPQKILDNPRYAMLSKTHYGAMYLGIVIPLTRGAVFSTFGPTKL